MNYEKQYRTPLLTRFLWWIMGEHIACRYDIGFEDGYCAGYGKRLQEELELRRTEKNER